MAKILIVAEHDEGKLRSATLPTIRAGQQIAEFDGGDLTVLVLGSGTGAVAAEAARYGARVLHVDAAPFANYLAEAWAPAVAAAARQIGATHVLTPATTTGKDFMPTAAALLDGGMVSDVIEIYEDDDADQIAYKRPIWAGNLIARVTSDADVTCLTIRPTNFEPAAAAGGGAVETITLGTQAPANAEFVRFDRVKSDRPELTDAKVVIAGGRGLKSGEAFGMLEELADKLGGAVGASRAAVDSGYAPNDWQIGQTGKIIAPNLYIGVAISGAIQHLAGMKGSKVIVAINKDGEAPIFQVADFGLVADAFKAVPELISKI